MPLALYCIDVDDDDDDDEEDGVVEVDVATFPPLELELY